MSWWILLGATSCLPSMITASDAAVTAPPKQAYSSGVMDAFDGYEEQGDSGCLPLLQASFCPLNVRLQSGLLPALHDSLDASN